MVSEVADPKGDRVEPHASNLMPALSSAVGSADCKSVAVKALVVRFHSPALAFIARHSVSVRRAVLETARCGFDSRPGIHGTIRGHSRASKTPRCQRGDRGGGTRWPL